MTNKNIAIIGGGFAGAVCAIHLMRLLCAPKSIVVYEPRDSLGLGLAYSVRDENLRLNVPPTRMNIGVDEEEEFSAWLQRKNPDLLDLDLLERCYLPRYVYGDFLQERLRETIASYNGEFTHKQALISELPRGFEKVFLCLGNGRSKAFHKGVSELIVNNPWDVEGIRRLASKQQLAIIGTGLSACDAAAVLENEGFTGDITFFSKQAKLPLVDGPLQEKVEFHLTLDESLTAEQQALQMIKQIRIGIAQYDQWQQGFNDFKAVFLKLWPTLSKQVQLKLDNKLRKFWFIHRYRMAPELLKFMEHQLAEERYQLVGQRVQEIRVTRSENVEIRLENDDITVFDAVINCAGPQRLRNPLVKSLIDSGSASISKDKAGLDISEQCHLRDAKRIYNKNIIVIGCLAESYYGDLVGASDIAEQIASIINS